MSSTFHDHFSSVAAQYADFRPRYPAALFDYLASLVPADSVVWECAAGSGQATIDLAERFRRVIATDASREQLASAPAHPKIDYRVAAAEDSGLANGSVSLVAVAQALHWFNLDRFYDEVRRVLAPNGVLAVWAYGINHIEGDAVDAVLQHYYSETVGPFWPPERKLVEDGYRTVPFPFPEIMPPAFEMAMSWTLEALVGYCSTWSATNRFIKAQGRNPLEPFRAELAQVWGDPQQPRRVTWPLSLRLGRRS